MAKHGGFGMPMGGNMNNMLKQAQKMQQQMQQQAEELHSKEFTANAGGGAVSVKVSGSKELLSVEIDKDAMDPEDVEILQDMIVAAVNEAMKKVDEANSSMMGKFTGGLNGLL